jgi:hypothetical protein
LSLFFVLCKDLVVWQCNDEQIKNENEKPATLSNQESVRQISETYIIAVTLSLVNFFTIRAGALIYFCSMNLETDHVAFLVKMFILKKETRWKC